jgi:hypothetical protein
MRHGGLFAPGGCGEYTGRQAWSSADPAPEQATAARFDKIRSKFAEQFAIGFCAIERFLR